MKRMHRSFKILLLLYVISWFGVNAVAKQLATKISSVASSEKQLIQVGCDNACCSSDSCGGVCCCEAVCCPQQVEKEVKEHCWKVESKLVCIPSFRWPWQRKTNQSPDCGDGCDCGVEGCRLRCGKVRCGKVRCVNVLEKHETTCKEYSYEWEAKCVRSSSRPRSGSQACCPRCGCE